MPDFSSPPPSQAGTSAHLYPAGENPATSALSCVIEEKIRSGGPMAFPDFMTAALYHPQLGYYARQTRQIGRDGDFFTSVSVGPLFGRLLARKFRQWWHRSGRPERWRVIEAGAHDGTLAADILGELAQLDRDAFSALEYAIPEPLPMLQAAQRKTLAAIPNVRLLRDPAELADQKLPGIAFGNEVLDALPFHVIEWNEGGWRECLVDFREGKFVWKLDAANRLPDCPGGHFPNGYRTEIRTCLSSFLRPLLDALSSGLLIFPDYGHNATDYYHPHRVTGTLRTFSQHRAAENPLENPGELDITAHVDFTAAARAAIALGCRPLTFQTQGVWLTNLSRDWLLSLEGQPDPSGIRQFQSLTHPGHLGSRFQILELSWNDPSAPAISPADAEQLALALNACPPRNLR